MKVSLSVLVLLVLAAFTSQAALQDFDITATREKLSMERGRSDGMSTVTSKEICYRINVKSRSFKALDNVEVRYNILYEDKEEGVKASGALKTKQGSQTFEKVGANAAFTLSTDPFQLTTQQLDGDWVWANGASNKTADRVVGIWIRIYVGGELKQEYCNPSTLTKKADWKD